MLDQPTAAVAESAGVYSLPRPRNPYFTGRKQVLEAIGRWRASERDTGNALALYGAGGIGKTEVALEYAHSNLENYGLIWWLPAEDPALLAWHFGQLAHRMGLEAARAADSSEARCAVLAALAERSDWLLIFDDAQDAASIRAYLPPRGAGHVLITSRDSKWHGIARSFCLRVLERTEAAEFLANRSGRGTDPDAATLAHALGNLPLALEQAAALIDQTGTSCGEYLRRFEEYWAELLQSGRSSGEYPDAVAMTWELTCRELEQVNVNALALLKLLVYLAPTELPMEFVGRAVSALPEPVSTSLSRAAGLDAAVGALTRFALASSNELTISVHHFVASITRDRLTAEGHDNWCKFALEMAQSTFAFDVGTPATWPQFARALPHALAVSVHAQAANIAPGLNAKLLNAAGEYLQQVGKYEQARTVLERAMGLCEQAYGPDNPRRSAIANNLGRVLKRLGDMNQARAYFEAALGLDEAAYGSSHPHVAEIVNNYGTVMYETGDMQTALQQFEFALDVCRSHYGSEHAKVATVENNVAYVRAQKGDLDNALDYFTNALATAELACGPDHPLVASIRTNLAIALRLKGQADAARAQLERAVAVSQATLGPSHSDLSRGFGHLGAVHLESGDFATARRYFQRALDIDERTLGKSHPLLVSRLKDLGRCLKGLGDVDGSVACFERAGQIIRNSKPGGAVT